MSNGRDAGPSHGSQGFAKLRRTQRVHIQMSVIVRGSSKNQLFEEETKTTTVNAQGCLVSLAATLARGQQVSIVNPKTAEELLCNVVYISENKASRAEVGLEFTEPSPLFWRIGFPPEDWVDSSERKREHNKPGGTRPGPPLPPERKKP